MSLTGFEFAVLINFHLNEMFLQNTMRKNLLNWCNLVSISKNVLFYAFLDLLTFSKFVNIYRYLVNLRRFTKCLVYICKISVGLMFSLSLFS